MDDLLKWWPVFTTLFGVLLYSYKAKQIEILKLKIEFTLDAFDTLSQLNSAVQSWAHPTGKDDVLLEKTLDEVWPKAQQAINKASLVVDPHLISRMRSMFSQINMMLAENSNWKMFLEAHRSGSNYSAEVEKRFTISRKKLPQEVGQTLQEVLRSLQYDMNGYLKIWWWDLKDNCSKKEKP